MSVLGRAYLSVSLVILILGLIWFTIVLQENRAWVEVVLLVPRLDFADPLVRKRFHMNVAALLAGWGGCVGLLALMSIIAPFRIRSMAVLQRRLRELEREILELRTLPLRQQEEDEILAAEAHLDIRAKKVMTEKMRRDRLMQQGEERRPSRELRGLSPLDSTPPIGSDVGFQPPAAARPKPKLARTGEGESPGGTP